jgi:hypothetical protein
MGRKSEALDTAGAGAGAARRTGSGLFNPLDTAGAGLLAAAIMSLSVRGGGACDLVTRLIFFFTYSCLFYSDT